MGTSFRQLTKTAVRQIIEIRAKTSSILYEICWLITMAQEICVFCNFQAMKLIPEEWSIGVISQFLSGSVRLSLHKSRKTKILRSLARGENIKASLYCKSISQMTWFIFSHTMLIMKSVHHISLFSCKTTFPNVGFDLNKKLRD